jgi:integrase
MLNTKTVKELAPPASGSRITYDHSKTDDPTKTLPGFGVRVTATGAKAFVLNYRAAGQERRLTIGTFPSWSVARARAYARELRVRIDRGEDPLAEREAERTAPTVRELAQRYVEEWLPRKRPDSARDDRAMLRTWILPALGSTKVAAVRPADVESLHRKITKTGAKTRANRVIGLLSKTMTLAVRWEYRPDNPVRGAVQRNPGPRRKRYLSGAEIARLSEALAGLPSRPAADAIRLLMLTGARKTEVLAARWSQFDLEGGTWLKPGSTTKQGTDHCVPLSAPALQLLAAMRATAKTEYLFPGRDGLRHLDIKTSWEWAPQSRRVERHSTARSAAQLCVNIGKRRCKLGINRCFTWPQQSGHDAPL